MWWQSVSGGTPSLVKDLKINHSVQPYLVVSSFSPVHSLLFMLIPQTLQPLFGHALTFLADNKINNININAVDTTFTILFSDYDNFNQPLLRQLRQFFLPCKSVKPFRHICAVHWSVFLPPPHPKTIFRRFEPVTKPFWPVPAFSLIIPHSIHSLLLFFDHAHQCILTNIRWKLGSSEQFSIFFDRTTRCSSSPHPNQRYPFQSIPLIIAPWSLADPCQRFRWLFRIP